MNTLIVDIETAPHRVYAWGLWGQDISTNQIVEPGYTLCWGAKWLGKPKVFFERVSGAPGTREFKGSFRRMVEAAHALLEEADAVIHYNGNKFDMPTLKKEFLMLGLDPPSPQTQIDLLRVVKKQFRFPSNKLDYVARALGLGGKVKHMGMDLWKQCMAGDESAWRVMRRYNIRDVRMLEPLYERLVPWIQPHPNMGLYMDSASPVCPNCGSCNVIKKGLTRTATQAYQRYKCRACGKWSRGRRNVTQNKEAILAGVA